MKTKEIQINDIEFIIFGSDENSFMIISTLIIKNNHAVLVGSTFTRTDANAIALYIKSKEYVLDSIYLLHGDPDYYFGLETIKSYFPKVIAYATESTFSHITNTVEDKLKTWSDVLGDQLPDNVVLPRIVLDDKLEILGDTWQIIGDDSIRTNLWQPESKLLIGGIDTFNQIHVFLPDTASVESMKAWQSRLQSLLKLNPEVVIPSHGSVTESFDKSALNFTDDYLDVAQKSMKSASNSEQFKEKMIKAFPNIDNMGVLDLSAKVVMKEIPWGE